MVLLLLIIVCSLISLVDGDVRTCSLPVDAKETSFCGLTPAGGDTVLVRGLLQDARISVVRLPAASSDALVSTDWKLTISRLVLLDAQLTSPAGSAQPALWPTNAFASVGSELTLQDVRLVVSTALFNKYLTYFKEQPTLEGAVNPNLHTDGRTYIHITNWTLGRTELQSVTLLSGPCSKQFEAGAAAKRDLSRALAWDGNIAGSNTSAATGLASSSGCNVYTADNSSVISALLGAGTVTSSEQLLLLLQSNASLGYQTPGAIMLRRPVAVVGLWSATTGLDFEMRVNHLDVMAPKARMAFASVVLENLGNGDLETIATTGPYTPLATVYVWALHCNRSDINKVCTVLMNVTLVVPSMEQMGIIGPLVPTDANKSVAPITVTAPSWSRVTFLPGPTSGSVFVINATGISTRMLDVLYTTRAMVAEPLDLPVRTYVDGEAGFTTPFVATVFNCADLKVGLIYRTQPKRLHVLLMRESFSLNRTDTPLWSSIPESPVAASAEKYEAQDPRNWNITDWPAPVPEPTCLGDKPIVPYRTRLQGQLTEDLENPAVPVVNPDSGAIGGGVATLGFAYTRNAMFIPDLARQSPFQLTLRSMVLTELSQGASAAELERTSQPLIALAPEAWTLLIWTVNNTLERRVVLVQHSVLKLPRPEYDYLAALGRDATTFKLDMAGLPDALQFTDVAVRSNHITAGSFVGPGIRGENVTLMVDDGALQALEVLGTPFWWPASYQPIPSAQQQSPIGLQQLLPAILVPVLAVLLLAAAAAVWLARRRRDRQQQLDIKPPEPSAYALASGTGFAASDVAPGVDTRSSRDRAGEVRVAVDKLPGSNPRSGNHSNETHSGDLSNGVHRGSHSNGSHRPDAPHVARDAHPAAGEVRPSSSEQLDGRTLGGNGHSTNSHSTRGSSSGSSLDMSGKDQLEFLPRFLDRRGKKQQRQGPSWQQQQQQVLPTAGNTPPPGAPADASNNLVSTLLTGLQRWRSAVSSTTLQLAEQRLAGQAAAAMSVTKLHAGSPPGPSLPPSDAAAAADNCGNLRELPRSRAGRRSPARQRSPAAASPQSSAENRPVAGSSNLVLKTMLGSGNFGQVWQGLWRGTPVAVKILHLPANALGPVDQQQQQQQQQEEAAAAAQSEASHHVAVMEAVLSSQCSHPNVVQMYTYMLTPVLTAADGDNPGAREGAAPTIVGEPGRNSYRGDVAAVAVAAAAACTAGGSAVLSAWELKLVMELCDGGTLRAALDKGVYNAPGAFSMDPVLVMLLARDVAAAMLHLHSENVVHGDLKAGNVLLTTGGADPDGLWQQLTGAPRRLVAKVADFGLSTVLGPTDTHASLTARGTPTHMAPESWSGRVSRAGDSYAFGMLLYEVITGLRPFAGTPLPMMAHDVAVRGVRPEWPPQLPEGFQRLQQLAEACWRHAPEDRPGFADVFDTLDLWVSGQTAHSPAWLGPLRAPGELAQHALLSPLPLLHLDELQRSQSTDQQYSQNQTRQQLRQQQWQLECQELQQQDQAQQLPQQPQQQQHGQQQGPQQGQQVGQRILRNSSAAAAPWAAAQRAQASAPSRGMNNLEWSEVSFEVASQPLDAKSPATSPASGN